MGDWFLIYSTDATGAPLTGSVNELAQAVRAGADVKVIYTAGPGISWSRYCASASTRTAGGATLVSATYAEAADTQVSGNALAFAAPFAVEHHIYNSNGVQWMSKGGTNTQRVVAMRWYVKDYEAPSLLLAGIRAIFGRRTE
jgi:hypothetical protein